MAQVHASAQANATSVTTGSIDTSGMNLLIVGTACTKIGTSATTDDAATPITDSKGNAWTRIGGMSPTIMAGAYTLYDQLFYCTSPTVGTGHTFTYTVTTATSYPTIAVLASNDLTSPSLDAGSNSSFAIAQSGTTLNTPSITLSAAGDLVVVVELDTADGAVISDNSSSPALTWTRDELRDGAAGQSITLGHALGSTTGSASAHFTFAPGDAGAGIAAFKAGAGGTTSTRTATPVTAALIQTSTRTATPVSVSVTIPGQHAYPIADNTIGNWTTNTGSTTNLYATVDEVVADDTDYVRSTLAPTGLSSYRLLETEIYQQMEAQTYGGLERSSDQLVFQMTSLSTPISGTRTLSYRYAKDAGTERIDLVVELLEGATVVQSWTHTDISTTWTQADQTVTGSITNYANLFVRLTASQV